MGETAYSYDPNYTYTSTPGLVTTPSQITVAIEQFIEQIQLDSNVVAGILFENPVQNQDHLWSISHLPITLIIQENVKFQSRYILQENGVDLCVDLVPRSTFRQRLGQTLVGDGYYNRFIDSRILFAKDPTVPEWYADIHRQNTISDPQVGVTTSTAFSKDSRIQLMNLGCLLSGTLAKAEKWCYVKNDFNYSFVYILQALEDLAQVEVLQKHQIPDKKPIHQALKLNPDFFQSWRVDFLELKKDRLTIQQALTSMTEYMSAHTEEMFTLILDHLKTENRICTATDLYHHFVNKSGGSAVSGCEWMVRQGWSPITADP